MVNEIGEMGEGRGNREGQRRGEQGRRPTIIASCVNDDVFIFLQFLPRGADGAAGVAAVPLVGEAGNSESGSAWAVATVLE